VKRCILAALISIFAMSERAYAAEICGNDIDDDGNGMIDEGCAPTLTTGVCESPLSCGLTGIVSWSTGALHYDLPPDVTPTVPFGPNVGLRRFYTSMYSPGTGPASVNHTPLGTHWQHTYMSWVDRYQVTGVYKIVLHRGNGSEIYATYASTAGGWESYTPQAGFHVMSIKRNTASPNQYQVQLLTGETLVYNSLGQIAEIWDNLAPTPNKVLITWTSTSAGNVSTVTDASGKRRLNFNYASNLLTSINYQLYVSGAWATEQTTTYAYSSGVLITASIGPSLSQQYSYTSGSLTEITDSAGKLIANFAYNDSYTGQVDQVSTSSGTVGMEFNSTRTGCTGNTALYFNLSATSSCSTDSDCPTDTATGLHHMCGGKTGTGATGKCFQAARCMTLSTVNGESVVTTVSPLGIGGGSCGGACTDVAQYVWSSGSTLLNPSGTKDPLGYYSSATYNVNGLPTQIAYADTDADPSNGGWSRTTIIAYDTTYPGRVAETRRQSDLYAVGAGAPCSATSSTGCAREVYAYSATDQTITSVARSGYTLDASLTVTPYTSTTTYSHDVRGRLTEVDGPVSGMKTSYSYYSSADPLLDGFLQTTQAFKDVTNHLDTTVLSYDYWGNATARTDPDGTVSCRTFDASRNYLVQTRETMAGQTSCASPNAADIVRSWARDSALRLSTYTGPDGACLLYSYASSGRANTVQRSDDCVSTGDYRSFIYTTDGQLSEEDTYTFAGVLKAKKAYTYAQSRRLSGIVNPVDSTFKTIQYDSRGVVGEVDDEAALGRTSYTVNGDLRTTQENRYNTSTVYDSWTFGSSWTNEQNTYVDGETKAATSLHDDAGNLVKEAATDADYPSANLYDGAGRRLTRVEGVTGSTPRTFTFTFDGLGRPLNNQYNTVCGGPGGPAAPGIQRTYDSMPSGIACPITGGCTNILGRTAYVKARLMCSSAYADYSLDQETFYAYDPAGNIVEEYVRDDSGRVADHKYNWNKNGEVTQFTTPSGSVLTWTYGTSGNNSDTDRVASISQNGTTLISNVSWFPWGPLAGYLEQATIGGVRLSTAIARNLAYRITNIQMNNGTSEYDGVALSEDSKGRITARDFFDNSAGVQDSFYVYDGQDRVLCEMTATGSTCPTSATTTIKNNFTASPPFTASGSWKTLYRYDHGVYSGDAFADVSTSHRISSVISGAVGTVSYGYSQFGERTSDAGSATNMTHSARNYTYDERHNLINVNRFFEYSVNRFTHAITWHVANVASTFDARDRRVSKTYTDATGGGQTSQTFYYYDPSDRVTEIKYTPDITASSTYSIYQIAWLGQRPVAMTETDFPAGTVSRRYYVTDETDRVIAMWAWPASGDSLRVWSIDPSGWGGESPLTGASIFQPLGLIGQFLDWDTYAANDSNVTYEPGLILNGFRTYDAFTGAYLQQDPLVASTRSSYVYASSNPVGPVDVNSGTLRPAVGSQGAAAMSFAGTPKDACGNPDGGGGGGGYPAILAFGPHPADNACKPTTRIYIRAYYGQSLSFGTDCISDLPSQQSVARVSTSARSSGASALQALEQMSAPGLRPGFCMDAFHHLVTIGAYSPLVYGYVQCSLDCDGNDNFCEVVSGPDGQDIGVGTIVGTPLSYMNVINSGAQQCNL
jgi:RHS repeat-associated protein